MAERIRELSAKMKLDPEAGLEEIVRLGARELDVKETIKRQPIDLTVKGELAARVHELVEQLDIDSPLDVMLNLIDLGLLIVDPQAGRDYREEISEAKRISSPWDLSLCVTKLCEVR